MTIKSKSRGGALALDILNHGALALVALLFLFPFFWMVSNAVRSNAEVLAIPVRILPNVFEWHNFAAAWTQLPFGRFFLNSLIVSISVTVITVVVSCLSGYAFARLKFPGRDALLMGYLATLMVPGIMLIIPLFLIVNNLGMVNTFQGVILPVAFGTFGSFLLRQFFMSIPTELEEAARIDGASRLRILVSIIVPLSMPAIGLLSLFTFIGQWNNFLWPLIVMTGADNATLPVGLTLFQTQQGTAWNYIMAGATLSMLPGIILAILLQKLIYNSIALNAGMGGR
ncbi:carbohydrate ABC transporter permease [Devosia neptuniae]|uniref:Carbohydrate ABC transporter permease n=1 Tax=Devosia neptuniae TaxID=191302 RepID=A0ABY6CAA4_9HYPH|nr:carbohydrate ABC transporter permease [Devosia neptuniae]UXN69074.1 carbohydrate ABC transporter permease [Devosia neptuniae]